MPSDLADRRNGSERRRSAAVAADAGRQGRRAAGAPGSRHPAGVRALEPERLPDHLEPLHRAALALSGSRDQADDLVQETCARVLARPRLLRGDDLGYLLQVLRNVFYNERRAAARKRCRPATPEELELLDHRHAPPPTVAVEGRELVAAVAALPEPFKAAVVAVDVIGLSYREAADALRTREGTVMSRLHRGGRQLARSLGRATR